MTLVIHPTYEPLREWIQALPTTFAQTGEVIYDARNQIRLMQAPDGSDVCVKRFHAPRSLNRWVYTFLRAPKAVRAYENALRLQQEGIGTPEVIAYILTTKRGLLSESYLISRRSNLTRNMYEFRHHPLDGYEPIVRDFARFTARMHEKGILHKDYSPGNILFDLNPDGHAHFELVDINRMRFDHPVNLDDACFSFRRLWGKEDFFVLLATEYAQARGWNEQECIRLTLRYWKRFWRHKK